MSRDSAFAEARSYLTKQLEGSLFRTQYPVAFVVQWFMERIQGTFMPNGELLDLGGGHSLTNAVLCRLGMRVHCADMMSEYFIHSSAKGKMTEQFDFLKNEGVHFIQCDLLDYNFKDFADASLDVICSFHAFEHLHHSPQRLCTQAMRKLKPGGMFFLEVPNALNALKRLRVLFGKTNYLPFAAFWSSSRWVGHVREYCLGDIRELGRRIHLSQYGIFGSNYSGTLYPKLRYSFLASILDRILRLRPGLCAALCLRGTK